MKQIKFYILKGHKAVVVNEVKEWERWFETADRTVGLTILEFYMISTVFIGIDFNLFDQETPLIFETMVFPMRGGIRMFNDVDCKRYSTWDEAVKGHEKMVRKYKKINLPT